MVYVELFGSMMPVMSVSVGADMVHERFFLQVLLTKSGKSVRNFFLLFLRFFLADGWYRVIEYQKTNRPNSVGLFQNQKVEEVCLLLGYSPDRNGGGQLFPNFRFFYQAFQFIITPPI